MEKPLEKEQSHLLLAKIGKRVLRPGGKELTQKLVKMLQISPKDNLVEFAPGIGFTAKMILARHPQSYTGIDIDSDHIKQLEEKIKGKGIQFILGNAEQSGLASNSVQKVIGEAMLSMHPNPRKERIVKEAHRILKKGGWYALHELEMTQPDMGQKGENEVKKDLSYAARVNAKPLTENEWRSLLQAQGFKILKIERSPMRLLELDRVLHDEGVFGTLRIGKNLLTKPKVRKRVFQMRNTFRRQKDHINAIGFLLEKI